MDAYLFAAVTVLLLAFLGGLTTRPNARRR